MLAYLLTCTLIHAGASSGGSKRGQANIIRPGWAAPIPRPTRGIDSVSLPGSQVLTSSLNYFFAHPLTYLMTPIDS